MCDEVGPTIWVQPILIIADLFQPTQLKYRLIKHLHIQGLYTGIVVEVGVYLSCSKERSLEDKMDFQDSLSDRLFDEKRMYTYVETYAAGKNMPRTSKALPCAREAHSGQVRKGKDSVPYIYHPLLIACHALALGMDDDDMISTALLTKDEISGEAQYSDQIFLIRYHMMSVVESVKRLR